MSSANNHARSRTARVFQWRYVWILAIAVTLLAVGYWLAPRRAEEIVSVDRKHAWRDSAAPPRRKIVWQPAEPIDTVAADAPTRASLIRPQLAEYGTVLYFTLCSPELGADICRSQLEAGKWQPAQPVAEINTAADEIGPVFQKGDRRLYFYSNRPGGYGGFDLYVSERTKDGGWSEPDNLGPRVNSPAHEYDPAVTADGQRLFFSSNRTLQMSRQMAEDKLGHPGDRWDSTLRADPGLPTFDLYTARRGPPEEQWSPAVRLSRLNRPDANEGSPYISPAGVFIYFASDRPYRQGEPQNFDLYRARIDGDQTGPAQNLGPGVNTTANEIEPALSAEGFRLVFSRNVPDEQSDRGSPYRLYASLATEVTEEVSWETGNFATLVKLLQVFWWWIVLALLLAALIAVLVWYLRQMSLRRLPVPTFVLTAVVIHVLLGAASFFVYFGEEIVAQVKRDLDEVAMIAHLSSQDAHQSHEQGEETYEKMADLEHVKTVKPSDVVRQVTESPEVPITPHVQAPNVPARLAHDRTPERLDATVPKAETVLSGGPDLTRRRLTTEELMQEQVEVEKTEASEETAETPPVDMEVALAPRRPLVEATDAPRIARRRLEPEMELPQERVEAERATHAPAETLPDRETVELERAARASPRPEATQPVETEEVEAPAETPETAGEPRRLAVAIERQLPAPQTDAPPVTRHRLSAEAALRVARPDSSVEQIEEPNFETKIDQQPTDLGRVARAAAEPAAPMQVATEQLAALSESAVPSAQPERLAVGVERQSVQGLQSGAPSGLPRRTLSDTAMRLAKADVTAQRTAEPAPDVSATGGQQTVISRAAGMTDEPAAPTQVAAEVLGRPEAAPAAPADPVVARVAVGRRAIEVPGALEGTSSVLDSRPGSTPALLAASNVETDRQVSRDIFVTPAGPRMSDPPTAQRGALRTSGETAGGEPIQTAALAAPAVGGGGPPSPPRGAGVSVARQSPAAPAAASAPLGLAMADSAVGSPSLSGQPQDAGPSYDMAIPESAGVTAQIARSNHGLGQAQAVVEAVAPETIGTSSATGDDVPNTPPSIAGISVGFERAAGPMLKLPIQTSARIGGVQFPDDHRLVIGSLESQAIDVPPSFGPLTSRIARRPARAPRLLYAEDSIGLASMMRLRQVEPEEKRDLVAAFGGDEKTLHAVHAGLAWIVKQQHSDGHWSLEKFADGKSGGQGKVRADTAATALALLPLLGDGNTHNNGPHRQTVGKGLKWLVDHQKDNGDLYTGGGGNSHMYSHGIAAIALGEAYGMTRDPELREPAQRAVDFIASAQHQQGGWRYNPGQAGDTSVFGWQIMALKSAQMAELEVPPDVLAKAKQWLDQVKRGGGEFRYQRNGHDSPAMTAEGLLCHQYLGAPRGDSRLQEGARFLLNHLPQTGKDTSYCWYYATQVMYHLQDEFWRPWNEAMKDALLGTQLEGGPTAGSWDPKDKWEQRGGRLYSTSLRLLMLEVYYRHLPLYQVLEQ